MKQLPLTESSTKILAMNLDRVSAQKTRNFIAKYEDTPLRRNVYLIDYWPNMDEKIIESLKTNGVILFQRPIENPTNKDYCYFLRTGNHLLYTRANQKPTLDEQTTISIERHCGDIHVKGEINARQSTYHFDIVDTDKKSLLRPLPKGNRKLFTSSYDVVIIKEKYLSINGLEKIIGNL